MTKLPDSLQETTEEIEGIVDVPDQRPRKQVGHVVVVLNPGMGEDLVSDRRIDRKRQPLAAYRFGGLECMLLGPGEGGLMSMIG